MTDPLTKIVAGLEVADRLAKRVEDVVVGLARAVRRHRRRRARRQAAAAMVALGRAAERGRMTPEELRELMAEIWTGNKEAKKWTTR